MGTNRERLKKILTIGAGIIPILTFVGSLVLWVDNRYMLKQISDTRFIDLQISIVQGSLRDYERLSKNQLIIDKMDETEYELQKQRLMLLEQERNRLLGIGGK